MGFLVWLEESAFAEWIRISTTGYPMMIAAHAVGMGVMVGLSLTLNLRLLGAFRAIPYTALNKLMGVAWIGLIINFLSGSSLLAAGATDFATDPLFLTKIALIVIGAASVAYLQPVIQAQGDEWQQGAEVPGLIRAVAATASVVWLTAIVCGRLTAYF